MKSFTLHAKRLSLIFANLLLSIYNYSSSAQGIIPASPNPDTQNYMRFGETSSVNHFYGEVGVSIPIYTYEDSDFKIPISLSYGSGGVFTDIEAGIIGKNWTLNLGGCVMRTVRGLPDDKILDVPEHITQLLPGSYAAQKHKYYGYARVHPSSVPSPFSDAFSYANSFPHSFPITGNGWVITSSGTVGEFIETTPDLFTFRFGDHYGSFMLQPNGGMNIFNLSQPDVNYKVTLSGFTPSESIYGKEIKITTGDGYTYIFGASYLAKQDFQTMDEGDPNQERPFPGDTEYNLTWPLTQIISPNGRSIQFEYDLVVKKKTIGVFESYVQRDYYLQSNIIGNVDPYYTESNNLMPNIGEQISSILRRVICDNATIMLDYTENDNWLKSITIRSNIGNNTSPQIFK